MSHKIQFLLFSILFFLTCCNNPKQPVQSHKETPAHHDSLVVKKDSIKQTDSIKPVSYHYLALDSVLITHLKDSFGEHHLNLILMLNRIDFEHVWRSDTLIIPDTFFTDQNRYSPFPDSLPVISTIKKLILFSYFSQTFAAYDSGRLVRWGPTSMGKRKTPTPTGLYFTNWKAKQTVSTENPEWKLNWYFNLDNKRGVSIHQYDLPGFPASHACMRLYDWDAEWIYNWADQWKLVDDFNVAASGTPVIIFGSYPFGKRKPWMSMVEDNSATHHTMEELNNVIEQYLPMIDEHQTIRDSINKSVIKILL